MLGAAGRARRPPPHTGIHGYFEILWDKTATPPVWQKLRLVTVEGQSMEKAFVKIDEAHKKMFAAERKYEQARKAQEELAAQHATELEIRNAFGTLEEGKGLEEWPMFPGRKVHRTLDSRLFVDQGGEAVRDYCLPFALLST